MNRLFIRRYVIVYFTLSGIFFQAYSQEGSVEDPQLRSLIHEYGYKGWYNVEYSINLDTAEYYLKKALELQYSSYDEPDDRVANNHVCLASVYRRFYNNSEALYHLNCAEDILKVFDPNSLIFSNIYNNKGNIIRATNDFYRTKEYYEYALDFLIKNDYQNTTNFSHIFSNYIKLLFELGEYDLAEEQLSMIDIQTLNLSPNTQFRFYITNATTYSKLDKYESASFYFDKARNILESEMTNEVHSNTITYYYHIVEFNILYEEYGAALKHCAKALSFIESLDPYSTKNKTIYHANILYRIATIKHEQGNYDRAIEIVNRGIKNLNKFFDDLSFSELNATVRNEYSSILPELYILSSRILFHQFEKSNSIDDLVASHRAYQQTIVTLNSLKLSMQNENSKFFATAAIPEIYNEAIYVGKLLFEMTGELQYLEKSFEFAESSKSFALFSEIKDVEAMEFSDLPADVREKEQRFIGEIQGYEEMLYEEQLSAEPDSSQIAFFRNKLFHLKDDYNDLMQDIELKYAKYFELKYNPKFVTLKEVQQKLPYRDALIEYVLTDTMLITYVIDKKGINVFSQEIGPKFASECIEYYNILHKQNFSNGVHDNYRRFVTLGRKFYQILIEPCLQYTDRENFTIVPDGAITYLPFEGLLTDDADTEYINYLILPYMIRDYSVGYSHSSTLMFSERIQSKSPENKVLAFAPEYINPLDIIDTAWIRQSISDSEFLLPLAGIIKEVQSINETVPSKVFLNEQATEANFKKYAPDYNVLHLAMHTIMKDDNPLHSLLAFTTVETSDTTEDNRLYAYEIYNLKLNAKMAVLSSCSSGFGKMQKGEGMMSLARGFIYAGCPSIVMTLWQVSDKSSSDLMTSFYRYLKRGKSKQEAMRLAKIDYLDAADDLTSNPYFWSGFVVVGDSSPIYRKSGMSYWMIIVTIFIGIIVFFQYRKS
ncbi:MAG: CHAT domain-containing protein [Bacteroidales bacterium]|nr:CHAT domain-containing protein [Bacteroidales bacterium]